MSLPAPHSATSVRIQEFREAQGLTKIELARLAGINERTVRNLEQGVYSPSLATARKLAAALEVQLSELLADSARK